MKTLLSKIVGLATWVIAFFAAISFVVLAINQIFTIVSDSQLITWMTIATSYAGIVLIILVNLKIALKLPIILTIPYLILIAAVVILNFFEPVYLSIVQTFIPSAS